MFDWLFGKKKKKKARKPSGPAPERSAAAPPKSAPDAAPAPAPRAEAAQMLAAEEPRSTKTADDILRELEVQPAAVIPFAEEPEMPEAPVDPNLARHLLAEGPVTREFIHQQIALGGKADSYLCRILAKVPAPSEEKLFKLLAAGYVVPQADVKQCKIPIAVARSIPTDLVERYKMIPIERVGDLLCIAFAGEVNPKGTEAARKATGLRVKAFCCAPQYLTMFLSRVRATPSVSPVVAPVPISEAEFEEAARSPEAHWEAVHLSRGPLRAVRIA